ncbi:cbb3-type cytochrome c oxidase subunit 3 [Thiomicrorhabdus sediminis]|nr:cbb3-type cytochrome c oxidase subunit 3 [Thiomicrorhabdus sediminis]
MSNLERYFSTDWAAMTAQDWAGLIVTIIVFLGIVITFSLALRPSKRKEMEEQKYKILDDED